MAASLRLSAVPAPWRVRPGTPPLVDLGVPDGRLPRRPVNAAQGARNDTLPSYDVVRAQVQGSGGTDDDLRLYVTAWRKIKMTEESRLGGP